jgi:hypothetical protein
MLSYYSHTCAEYPNETCPACNSDRISSRPIFHISIKDENGKKKRGTVRIDSGVVRESSLPNLLGKTFSEMVAWVKLNRGSIV